MSRVTILDKQKGKYFFSDVVHEITPEDAHCNCEEDEIPKKSSIVEEARQKFMQDARDAWKGTRDD